MMKNGQESIGAEQVVERMTGKGGLGKRVWFERSMGISMRVEDAAIREAVGMGADQQGWVMLGGDVHPLYEGGFYLEGESLQGDELTDAMDKMDVVMRTGCRTARETTYREMLTV